MQAPILEVRHLGKRYGDLDAVRDISFRVAPGEILGVVGPNGAGKTSTLRCVAGILQPTVGYIRICGHELGQSTVEAKRQLAFLPDEPRLFEYLSVQEHLNFIARLYGVKDWESRAASLLAELELTGKERARPSELSRGMKQKLSIACGLLHEPPAAVAGRAADRAGSPGHPPHEVHPAPACDATARRWSSPAICSRWWRSSVIGSW